MLISRSVKWFMQIAEGWKLPVRPLFLVTARKKGHLIFIIMMLKKKKKRKKGHLNSQTGCVLNS